MTDSHSSTVRDLARGGGINLAGTVVAAVFGLALTWIMARGTSLTDAGVFFATTSLFMILVAVAQAGGEAGLPRFIPLLRAQRNPDGVRVVIRLACILTLALGFVVGLVALVANGPLNHILGLQETHQIDTWVLASLAVALPLAALANVLMAATRGYFSIRATVLIDKIGRTLAQFVLVGAAILLGSVGLMIEAWLVPMALAVVPAAWSLRQLMGTPEDRVPDQTPPQLPDDPEDSQLTDEDIAGVDDRTDSHASLQRSYLHYSWPRAISRLLQMVLQRADVVIVAAMLSPGDAAVYAVATRLIVLGQTAAMSLQQVLAPHLSHLIEVEEYGPAMHVARISAAWTILLCWPLYLLSISAGPFLLGVLGGPEYATHWLLLCLLAVGMLIASASGPVDTLLLMAGKSSLSLWNMIVAVVTDLVLLFTLLPSLGITGAGIAWAVALTVRAGLGVLFVKRMTGLSAFGTQSLLAIGITVVAFLVVPYVLDLRDQGVTVAALAILVAATGIQLGLSWVFRRQLSLTAFGSLTRRGSRQLTRS